MSAVTGSKASLDAAAALLALVRQDLRGFSGYASARSQALRGEVWLNANESPWANPADAGGGGGDQRDFSREVECLHRSVLSFRHPGLDPGSMT